jgi:hypothetical protein
MVEKGESVTDIVSKKTIKGDSIDFKLIKYAGRSIVHISRQLLVEPCIMISNDLQGSDQIENVARTVLELFIGHYVQAFNVMTKVENIEVGQVLASFNISEESDQTEYSLGLQFGPMKFMPLPNEYKYDYDSTALEGPPNSGSDSPVNQLVIGFNVTLDVSSRDDRIRFSVPVVFRAKVFFVPFDVIKLFADIKSERKRLKMRWHEWRSGAISLADLIFANDLIREYKKSRLNMSTASGDDAFKRRLYSIYKSAYRYATTQSLGLRSAMSSIVVNTNQARELEYLFGGSLDKRRIRDKFFSSTQALFLAVVDEQWERVTIYTDSLDDSITVSFKGLMRRKNDSVDLTDLFKSFISSTQPTL